MKVYNDDTIEHNGTGIIESVRKVKEQMLAIQGEDSLDWGDGDMISVNELIPELLIGTQVFHKKWLVGNVISIDNKYVRVKFDNLEKQFQFPEAFNQFLKIHDEDAYGKLVTAYKNKDVVKRIESREIEKFVHFTKVNNLDSILQNGLVPVAQLKEKGIGFDRNDVDRWDNRLDANSLSVTAPNYQMFYRYKNSNPNSKWAVICYHAKHVANLNCAYFAQNAASYAYINRNWDEFTSLHAFEAMFKGDRADLYSFETTNPQAEVMVRGVVPSAYIESVCFEDYSLFKEYEKKYPRIEMCYNKYYFQPRRDYERWRKSHGD